MADRRVVRGGNRTGWLIGGVVAVVIALAVYFFFWNGSFSGYGTATGAADDTEIVLPAGD